MLRPSYTELMEKLNSDSDMDNKITSRYVIVIAAAKRARQLIDRVNQNPEGKSDKVVSIAVNEMFTGKIKIKLSESNDMSKDSGYDEDSNINE